MPILRRNRPWGAEVLIGFQPLVNGSLFPFVEVVKGGWSCSRMTEGSRWADSPKFQYVMWTGGSGHKRLTGVAKDSAGAALPGATCWAYRKDDDVANSRYRYAQEGTVGVSDAGGNYEVMVPTNDQYGIVSYKAGSPDVAGVTVNTLVGT